MQQLNLHYSLTAEDFLQHQLFSASKSERIKNKRLKSQLIALGAVLLFSFFAYRNGHIGLMYAFLGFAVYTLIFYPRYLASQYKNHYKKYIAETCKARVGVAAAVQIDDQRIEMVDKTGETKIYAAEVKTVIETGNYFYIHFKMGEQLIIPKAVVEDSNKVKEYLTGFCSKLGIPYSAETA